MNKILALVRISYLTALSYRLSTLLSLGALLVTIVPLYFVANALQPLMADSIAAEGGQYFAFILVGMIAFSFLSAAVSAVPNVIGGGISSGTFEALTSTPTRLPILIAGLSSYSFFWLTVRAAVLLVCGAVLGAQFAWQSLLVGIPIVGLIILSYLPFGILAGALILTFRTAGPMSKGLLTLSALLGGVYYPTHVIPSWLEQVSSLIPLTYGLRALRQTVLDGQPVSTVASDLMILAVATALLLAVTCLLFIIAFRHARRSGTLMHY